MTSSMVWGLIVVIATSRLHRCQGLSLPPVYWNMSNPMFKASNNDHIVDVKLGDTMDFVCPHHYPGTDTHRMEYYTIYQVSRWEYDHCTFSPDASAMLIVNCTNPRQKRRFTIWFDEFAAIPNVPEFRRGETYYYITTSTGEHDGMANVYKGACYYSNMKLQIHVCCGDKTEKPDKSLEAESDSKHYEIPHSNSAAGKLLPVHSTSGGYHGSKASSPHSDLDPEVAPNDSPLTVPFLPNDLHTDQSKGHSYNQGTSKSHRARQTVKAAGPHHPDGVKPTRGQGQQGRKAAATASRPQHHQDDQAPQGQDHQKVARQHVKTHSRPSTSSDVSSKGQGYREHDRKHNVTYQTITNVKRDYYYDPAVDAQPQVNKDDLEELLVIQAQYISTANTVFLSALTQLLAISLVVTVVTCCVT